MGLTCLQMSAFSRDLTTQQQTAGFIMRLTDLQNFAILRDFTFSSRVALVAKWFARVFIFQLFC
jgi:hypothetical protein